MTTITTLKLDYDNGGRIFTVYPTIIFDEHQMVMIDCGYPGHLPKIQELALMQGIDLNRLSKIIVTHNDIDHMGALAAFKKTYPHIEIIASHLQAQYITGEQTTIRLQLALTCVPTGTTSPTGCTKETDRHSDFRGNGCC
jgi:glyoxylase-like metal-dependent hydrolase (beta-lactamase superfamily II)